MNALLKVHRMSFRNSVPEILVLILLSCTICTLRVVAQEAGTLAAGNTASTGTTENAVGAEVTEDEQSKLGIPRASVRIEGREIIELTGANQLEVFQRAERVNRRLELLVEREPAVAPFSENDIVNINGQPLITLGGEPILTVTPSDAEDHLQTAEELASVWGTKLSVAVKEARAARTNPLRGVGILVRNSIRDLFVSLVTWLPRLAGVFLLWLVFWPLARLARWLVTLTTGRIKLDPNLRQLLRTVTFYGVWATGVIAMLSTLGIDSTSIAAAVGVSGFVLGFAFKDILAHFFAGLMLLLGRQFHVGSQIVVGEFEGIVERIELRALHLRTYDNRLVTIPNGDVFTSAVTSNNAHPLRRREFSVGIGYENDIQQVQRIVLGTLQQVDGVLPHPEPEVLVHDLTPSYVLLRVLYHANPSRHDWLKLGSECIREVKEELERQEISVPAETRSLQLRNVEGLGEVVSTALLNDGSRENCNGLAVKG